MFSLWPRNSEMNFLLVLDPRNFFHLSETVIFKLYIMSSIELIFFWGQEQKERSFLNPWVIRRTLVFSVVSGHDINIEF